ncbi:MAG: glutathione binding-like protein [Acetobacteraceae bacterium]
MRANVDRWMDWAQTVLCAPQSTVFQGLVRTPPEERNTGAIEAAAAEAGRAWLILDAKLAEHDYIAGPDFTLADIAVGPHVHRWFSFTLHRPETPHLHAWYHRLLARPVYRQHCAGPIT